MFQCKFHMNFSSKHFVNLKQNLHVKMSKQAPVEGLHLGIALEQRRCGRLQSRLEENFVSKIFFNFWSKISSEIQIWSLRWWFLNQTLLMPWLGWTPVSCSCAQAKKEGRHNFTERHLHFLQGTNFHLFICHLKIDDCFSHFQRRHRFIVVHNVSLSCKILVVMIIFLQASGDPKNGFSLKDISAAVQQEPAHVRPVRYILWPIQITKASRSMFRTLISVQIFIFHILHNIFLRIDQHWLYFIF